MNILEQMPPHTCTRLPWVKYLNTEWQGERVHAFTLNKSY